jgi:transposase
VDSLVGRVRQHREGTSEIRKRRRFTAAYKAEAVKRIEESGKALQAVIEERGLHANPLRRWRNEQRAIGSAEALARQKGEAARLVRRSLPPALIHCCPVRGGGSWEGEGQLGEAG